MAHAPQLSPHRFSLEDAAAIQASLRRDGYAVVASAATQAELEQARALLWQHLEAQHSWQRDQPRTWTDEAFEQPDIGPPRGSSSRRHGLGGNPRSGLLGSTVHSDCFWYCRTLPGVLRAFEIAYRTDDLVTAFDNMAINRPITCEQPALANMTTGRGEGVGHRWDASLHTHHNQDEFGDEVFICYAILPLWDMNEQTGATAIAPGSHTPGNVAAINEWRANNQEALADTSDPDRHLKPFWALGIQPGPIQVRAGDLCIFDTALFHSACPATDPYGDELLRAICIMSMAPRLLLSPTILRARRLAFEAALGTGGSVLGRVGAAEQMLLQHEVRVRYRFQCVVTSRVWPSSRQRAACGVTYNPRACALPHQPVPCAAGIPGGVLRHAPRAPEDAAMGQQPGSDPPDCRW
jgi:hypothetical protein